ncbi:hypothetical protein [Aestuariivirga sp.]|uniref:hypothetical protein n=1 Tax=Aestuariivirga sp. TaxID=2650926 RepID=UPI003BAC6339
MRNHITCLVLLAAVAALTGCDSGPNDVRITHDKPVAAALPVRRSEPIFYNGKTYHLDMNSKGAGLYDLSVSGMSAKQQKDAVAVATSSLGYFACPDGQKGKLTTNPAYADSKWRMQAKCG